MLNLLDAYVGGFPMLVIGILELLIIVHIYGTSYSSKATEKYPMRLLRGMFLTGIF